MKRIAILGSTGSIGTSALEVARTHPDRVEVVAIAAATNVGAMVKQILEFRPRAVAMATGDAMDKLCAGRDRRAMATAVIRMQKSAGALQLRRIESQPGPAPQPGPGGS